MRPSSPAHACSPAPGQGDPDHTDQPVPPPSGLEVAAISYANALSELKVASDAVTLVRGSTGTGWRGRIARAIAVRTAAAERGREGAQRSSRPRQPTGDLVSGYWVCLAVIAAIAWWPL